MFQHAVRVILATSGQHKAEVIAEQCKDVTDESLANAVHFLNNVRQARASIERILENGRATR
jgi:hypothetical protein